MKINTLKACPVCNRDLIVSKLKCTECDMEYSGNFQMPLFANLDDNEIEFVKSFLKHEGNISKLQKESGKTYAAIKNTLTDINIKLNLIEEKKEDYSSEGMSIGMCFGVAVATALHINVGIGMMVGMLLGLSIGLAKEKEKSK